jgi:ribonuclease G
VSNDLVINVSPEEVIIAQLKNKELVELNKERRSYAFNVGDYYLARVTRVIANLNAAFVDVGYEKDAFLHYLDLGPEIRSLNKFVGETLAGRLKHPSLQHFRFEPQIKKDGKIADVLKAGQHVLVKIAKEPISQKGPRLSCELSFPGRYIVLVPFSDKVSVSTKIRDAEERERLKNILTAVQPKNFGIIVRTAAEHKSQEDLEKDLADLKKRWSSIHAGLKEANPPAKVLGELNRTTTLLRDMVNKDFVFDNIYVNDQDYYDQIREYALANFPEREKTVKLFKGRLPIMEHFGVNRMVKMLFGKNVPLKSGAYLIIEHTEALHVIDVNSGNNTKSGDSQEAAALAVNLEAAEEIARQLRLRDIGGIIVVDFIDMYKADNRKVLYKKMKDAMKDDRAKHNVLPPSKIGLIQITRERVRPQIHMETTEVCPACAGTGKIESSILLADEIETRLINASRDLPPGPITLMVHPYVEAYLKQGKGLFSDKSLLGKWKKSLSRTLQLESRTTFHMLEYHVFDPRGEEV